MIAPETAEEVAARLVEAITGGRLKNRRQGAS